jgi:integrase
LAEAEIKKMRFPKTIKNRGFKVKIYGKTLKNPCYRLDYRSAGKRHQPNFQTYSEAKKKAVAVVRDLANGSQAAALTAPQSRVALAALQMAQDFYEATGRRVSTVTAVSEYFDALRKLNGRGLNEAVEGFLRTVANVKRKDIKEAVEEFIQADEPRTMAAEGQRSQLSAKYAYVRAHQLRKFADMFPNTAICDLTKGHLDAFIDSLKDFAAKTRNHYRTSVQQFLRWAVRKDLLSSKHRLDEADGMHAEHPDIGEICFYTPRELTVLLANADDTLRPLIAIGGLAGLRTEELLRLDWSDVWRRDGHIELTGLIAKGRFRRLVVICPALSAWLKTFRDKTGKVWVGNEKRFQRQFLSLCEKIKMARKENGLRHAFCTFYYALYDDENQTAKQAGNSPAMIHTHYKGLATKAEGKKWFSVMPSKKAS